MPLQRIGHEDLDKSQALCAPVRPVQLISTSSRGTIRFAGSKHRPDDPCILVGTRHLGAVETAPLPKLIDPLIIEVCLGWRRPHHSSGAMNEQAAPMLAPALGDAQ